ncbi:MAG: PEP-CTERM sorting domain-containing protein [Planctomycetota bacterium]
MRAKSICAIAALVSVAGAAQGSFIDSDPHNDTPAGAHFLGNFVDGDSDVLMAALMPHDIDWFKIYVGDDSSGFLTTITFPLTDPRYAPDTVLGVFDESMAMVNHNNDANGAGSAVRVDNIEPGIYYLAVTGLGDDDWNGLGHIEHGMYALTLSYVEVPTPGSLALAGLGGGVLAVRRRRR